MTDTRYTYAGARIKALENTLLSETQLERLLGAKSVTEGFQVLQDTFLAPYLGQHERSNLGEAIEQSMNDTKKLLASIAPDPELLYVFWLKYDFFNLRTIAKAKRAGLGTDEIKEKSFGTGLYPIETLIKATEENSLHFLNRHLRDAWERAESATHIADIDIAMNVGYFEAIKDLAAQKKSVFLNDFVALLINLFNLRVALRALRLKDSNVKAVHVEGGRFSKKELETEKDILEAFKKCGGEETWKEALAKYSENNDFSLIEKAADEYTMKFLKDRNYNIFSPVPLFSYFTARKNNVQLISGIMTEKEAGLSEGEIRHIFRKLYK